MGNRTYGADRPGTKAFLEKHLMDAIGIITKVRNVACVGAHENCGTEFIAGYESAMKLVLSLVGVVEADQQNGK